MVVISADGVGKSYGIDIILEDVSFNIAKGDRIGIVGPNGAGKTTLLEMIVGEKEPTSGSIYIKKDIEIGYVKQKNPFDPSGTIIEEVGKSYESVKKLEARLKDLQREMADSPVKADEYTELLEKYEEMGGYSSEGRIKSILLSMGFEESEWDKKISMLSGGERTRLALACILMKQPDVLILDEPTNHLDFAMLTALEKILSSYKETVIVVSHDRFFLDKVATKIFDVRNTRLKVYKGNYTEYKVKRAELEEAEQKAYNKAAAEIKKQEELIRRFKERGTEKLDKRARSREKKLEAMEPLKELAVTEAGMRMRFSQDYKSGKDVIEVERLCKSFGEKELFKDIEFSVKSGEHICLVGKNGAGKSTLMKILVGSDSYDRGYLKIGHNVNIGYFDQEQLLLDNNETVLSEMQNAYRQYSDTEMRSLLGRFLFKGDDVFKRISQLSGGEKSKLSLLKLMLSGANTLLLDEPTNHLDIDSKEAVENALMDFEGTALIVSHDRYLLSKVPDKIFELEQNGIIEYLGKFDYYIEKREELNHGKSDSSYEVKGGRLSVTKSQEERKLQKQQEAEERKRRRRAEELEKLIDEAESEIASIEELMCRPENASNVIFLHECEEKRIKIKEKLDAFYDEWYEIM